QRLMAQNQRLAAVEESWATRLSRSNHPRKSATSEKKREATEPEETRDLISKLPATRG
ncbi:hypothetical protein A2U01_0082446, partial [Trifolium medium]|nr:hypothetical protein [Trifolium medium]